VGIACFGPLGVNPLDPSSYGRILASTPKKEWRNVDILSPLLQACTGSDESLPPPHKIDTDVNAPALAEYEVRKANDDKISSLAYVTVGTGVGVGLIVNSLPVHGMMHPEAGHVCVSPLAGDTFKGYSWGKERCPYQGKNTVEGIASSVALGERLGLSNREDLANISDDDDVWDHAANALASLCASLVLTLSIEGIVIGGGVMKRNCLYKKINIRLHEILNGYVSTEVNGQGGTLVREATWGNMTGLVGAVVLAKRALELEETRDAKQTKEKKESVFWKSFVNGAGMVLALTGLVLIVIGRKKS